MQFEQVLSELTADLPWMDNVRLIVGPLASREAVKDELLKRVAIIPSTCTGTFAEFARDILNKSKVSVDKILTISSQCDALERVATTRFMKEAVPGLCAHLKTRQVSLKVARFLTHFERFYVDDGELDAVVEYFQGRDPNLGGFTRVITELWKQGDLTPWGEGFSLRRLLTILDARENLNSLPKKIWLWGFLEFTPLEEACLERLARLGVEVCFLVPGAAEQIFQKRCQALGLHCVLLDEPNPETEVWEPHSIWDEAEFLRDELEGLRQEGVAWDEITVLVPDDDLYKRFVRQKFREWNVPLHDPTLSGAWKDEPHWIWWRDLLRVMASGLKLDDVRAWLGPGFNRKELFEHAFKEGVHGGAAQWSRLLKRHDDPGVRLLVEGVGLFGKAMTPPQFLSVAEAFVPRMIELIGERPGTDVFLEFCRHLATSEERPYLNSFCARLPRYAPLFEEFLDAKSRTQSLRSPCGVNFLSHGLWLPRTTAYAFALGIGMIKRARPSADIWDWEAMEVQKLWNKLHFGMSFEERALRDEACLLYGLQNHSHIVYSATEYGGAGEHLAKTAFYQKLKEAKTPARSGGHAAVGWLKPAVEAPGSTAQVDSPQGKPFDGPIAVSRFEDYLKCPFLYYGRHVLKIEREDELGLDPDGRARGKVLHSALEAFLREEINGEGHFAEFERARKRLVELIDQEIGGVVSEGEFSEGRRGHARGLPGLYRYRPLIDKARAVIIAHAEKWLVWEFENRKTHPELRPYSVEKPIELDLGFGFKLRGKIDRVDSDGEHAVILDYKTGAAPFIGRELKDGIGAQLLMYSRAVELETGLKPGAAYYLTIGTKVNGTSGIFLKKHLKRLHSAHARNSGLVDGEFVDLFDAVLSHWRRTAEALARGEFAPKPARPKKDCPKCSYQPICGYAPDDDGAGEPS